MTFPVGVKNSPRSVASGQHGKSKVSNTKIQQLGNKYLSGLSPIGSMYGIYANIGGILMVNVTIYTIHGSYGSWFIHVYPIYT